MSCQVRCCKNNRRFRPENVSFHLFPTEETLLKAWVTKLELQKFVWSKNKFVCSNHFAKEDFMTVGPFNPRLRPNAIPSQNLHVSRPSTPSFIQDSITTVPFESVFILESSTSSIGYPTKATDTKRKCLKRALMKPSTSKDVSTDTSKKTSSSGTQDKRRKFVQIMHNYSISPGKIKKKNVALLKDKVQAKKMLYTATREIKKLKSKIITLEAVVRDIKNKYNFLEGEDIPLL